MITEISPGVESGWLLIGEEVGYIVDVTAEMMIKDQATPVLRAGDPFLIPPRTPHSELDRGPAMGCMFPTYIVEVGQPLPPSRADVLVARDEDLDLVGGVGADTEHLPGQQLREDVVD